MEPSYVQEVPICWTSTESAKLWLYWRKMTGTARNTVRRFQRDIPHKGHHGRAWRAMEANLEAVRKLFYDCRGELFSHAPVYEGRHQHGAAGPAHAAEVLHSFSPGAPAEQADEDGTL